MGPAIVPLPNGIPRRAASPRPYLNSLLGFYSYSFLPSNAQRSLGEGPTEAIPQS